MEPAPAADSERVRACAHMWVCFVRACVCTRCSHCALERRSMNSVLHYRFFDSHVLQMLFLFNVWILKDAFQKRTGSSPTTSYLFQKKKKKKPPHLLLRTPVYLREHAAPVGFLRSPSRCVLFRAPLELRPAFQLPQ